MPKSIFWALRLSTAMLVFVGFVAYLFTPMFEPFHVVVPLVLLGLAPIAERIDARYVFYRRLTTGLTIGYTLFLPISLIRNGLMEAVTALFIFILGYKLLHRKSRRGPGAFIPGFRVRGLNRGVPCHLQCLAFFCIWRSRAVRRKFMARRHSLARAVFFPSFV